jgi:hypothetical protein
MRDCLTLCSCTGHSLKAVRCPVGLPAKAAPFMVAALQPAHCHTQAMWHHATLQFADLLVAVREITAIRHFPAPHFRSNAETLTMSRKVVSLSAGRHQADHLRCLHDRKLRTLAKVCNHAADHCMTMKSFLSASCSYWHMLILQRC